MAGIKENAAFTRLPDRVHDAAVGNQILDEGIQAVGHYVAGSQQFELIRQRPIFIPPGPVQDRTAAGFGGRQPALHDCVRVEIADRGLGGVEGDTPDGVSAF